MSALEIPILNNEYKVIVCWKGKKRAMKKYGYEDSIEYLDENNRGRIFYRAGRHPLIVLRQRPDTPEIIGALAHEATHAINAIWEYVGETSKDEAYAASVGAIVRETLKRINE